MFYVYIALTNDIVLIDPCWYDNKHKRFILDPSGETFLNLGKDDIFDDDLQGLLDQLDMSEEEKDFWREHYGYNK